MITHITYASADGQRHADVRRNHDAWDVILTGYGGAARVDASYITATLIHAQRMARCWCDHLEQPDAEAAHQRLKEGSRG